MTTTNTRAPDRSAGLELPGAGFVGRITRLNIRVRLTPTGEVVSAEADDVLHAGENALQLDPQRRDDAVRFVDELLGLVERATDSDGS